MRAVISGASSNLRPRRKASKKRGGSKMLSFTSVTRWSRTRTNKPPSPSTRARTSTLMVLAFMGFALFPERFGVRVEGTEGAHELRLGDAQGGPARAHSNCIGRFFWPEAAIAAAVVSGAQGAAPGQGDGSEARCAVRDHDANGAAPLALHAHAVRRGHRLSAVQEGVQDFDELKFVDGAAAQLKIDEDVVVDGCGFAERFNVFRFGVNHGNEIGDILEIP